jgi:hypothetical protein
LRRLILEPLIPEASLWAARFWLRQPDACPISEASDCLIAHAIWNQFLAMPIHLQFETSQTGKQDEEGSTAEHVGVRKQVDEHTGNSQEIGQHQKYDVGNTVHDQAPYGGRERLTGVHYHCPSYRKEDLESLQIVEVVSFFT